MAELLVVEKLRKTFPGVLAVADVSFSLRRGEILALIGENGAGKIKIVSMDRNSDVLQKINAGVVTGTIAQDDCAEMVWCLMVLFSKHHFDPPLSSNNERAGVDAAPANIFTSVSWVDKSNVQYFLEANRMYQP